MNNIERSFLFLIILSSSFILSAQRTEETTWYHNGELDVIETKEYSNDNQLLLSVVSRYGAVIDSSVYERNGNEVKIYNMDRILRSKSITDKNMSITVFYRTSGEPFAQTIEEFISDKITRTTHLWLPENRIDQISDTVVIGNEEFENFLDPQTYQIVSTRKVENNMKDWRFENEYDEDGNLQMSRAYKGEDLIYSRTVFYSSGSE